MDPSFRDIVVLGGILLGFVLALLKRPWWSAPLIVGAVAMFNLSKRDWSLLTSEPVWLFIGVTFYSVPALIGWGVGRLFRMLYAK